MGSNGGKGSIALVKNGARKQHADIYAKAASGHGQITEMQPTRNGLIEHWFTLYIGTLNFEWRLLLEGFSQLHIFRLG